jgi:menaquinone-dependent protoporphyrinogen oxidase
MKTLIAYATKYGCTEKCAKALSEKLTGEVRLCNLKTERDIEISEYDKVIVGGSIRIGKIQKEVKEFCSKNLNELLNKKVGLFICCMADNEAAEKQLKDSFPKGLLDNAIVKENFGGEFILQKMNFFDRLIVKKAAKIDKDTSNIYNENIDRFANAMNDA